MNRALPGSPRPRTPPAYLNLNVRGMPISPTIEINERSKALQKLGRKVYRLGLGQSPFPIPEPVVEALRRHAHEKDYLPVAGLPELREAVAEHHRRSLGVDCSPEQVLVGPGSKELMFLMQLVYYGDIIIPTPSWVSYAPQAQIIGRHIRFLQTRREDAWKLTPDQLEKLCHEDRGRPRILVLNYPSNPTGVSYSDAELRELALIARRFRVVVLSDEIYGKIHHSGEHTSIVRYYPDGTIFSGGLSKWCGAGGWRLGVFVVPRRMLWLLNAMAAVASETFTSTSTPIQHAAIRAFQEGPEIEAYLRRVRCVLAELGGYIADRLRAAGIHVLRPEGAFYVFPDFSAHRETLRQRGIRTSTDFCNRLLEETGVAILPGSAFCRDPEELTARLAYVDFDGGRALRAVGDPAAGWKPDVHFLRQYCAPVLTAVDILCNWVRTGR